MSDHETESASTHPVPTTPDRTSPPQITIDSPKDDDVEVKEADDSIQQDPKPQLVNSEPEIVDAEPESPDPEFPAPAVDPKPQTEPEPHTEPELHTEPEPKVPDTEDNVGPPPPYTEQPENGTEVAGHSPAQDVEEIELVETLPRNEPRSSPSPPSSPPSSPATSEKPVKPPRLNSRKSKSPATKTTDLTDSSTASPASAAATAISPNVTDKTDIEAANPGASGDNVTAETQQLLSQPKQDAVQPKKSTVLDRILGNKWIILGVVLVVLIALIILIVGVSVSRPPAPVPPPEKLYDDPQVSNTKCGRIEGTWEQNYTVAAFKGIPYMKAPVGDLRWSYEPLLMDDCADISETIQAKEFKGPCFQPRMFDKGDAFLGSEDCLYLNVWTPALKPDADYNVVDDGKGLPVLVYIHGGYLHFSSGHADNLSPSAALAEELNAVLVSFNYRLNVFGWLALKGLSNGTEQTGNYGLYDQVQALKWVQQYIELFGGNKDSVTLLGHSSGATVIYPLLANLRYRSLFHRAWLSGASSKFESIADKETTLETNAQVFLRNYNCPNDTEDAMRRCLLGKTSAELVEGIPWIQYPTWNMNPLVDIPAKGEFVGAVLTADGTLMADGADKTLGSLSELNMPIVISNPEYETDALQVTPVAGWTWAEYSDYVRSKMDSFSQSVSDEILNEFAPHLKPDARLHFAKVVSDMKVICPQTFLADILQSINGTQIYRFVMTESNVPDYLTDKYMSGSRVPTHYTDMLTFFHYNQSDSDEFKRAQSRFRSLVTQFMLEGTVGDWEEYPSVYAVTSHSDSKTEEWTSARCARWQSYYPDYSWMN